MKTSEIIYDALYNTNSKSYHIFNDIISILILISCIVIALESVEEIHEKYHSLFFYLEVLILAVFTVEYVLRAYFSDRKANYILSPFGIIDLLVVISGYFYVFGVKTIGTLWFLRLLRIIRLLRVLKLLKYSGLDKNVVSAILDEKEIINLQILFLLLIFSIFIFGSLLYFFEHETNQEIKNIPKGMKLSLQLILGAPIKNFEITTIGGETIVILCKVVSMILLGIIIGIVGKILQIKLLGEIVK